MMYPDGFFDNCNGLVPQIVYCIALLQAGNEKQQKYEGVLKDLSQSAVWQLTIGDDGVGYLNLSGYVPLAESRYLLNRQSIVERVSALNSYNVALVADSVGLPFDGIAPNLLEPVVLPTGINHLTENELIVETRLVYLLYLLEKRTNLYKLNNFIRYVYLISLHSPITGDASTGFTVGSLAVFSKLVDICFNALFAKFPDLERLIYGFIGASTNQPNRIESMTNYVITQLNSSNPDYVPSVVVSEILDDVRDKIDFLINPELPGVAGDVVTAGNDVSSEIKSSDSNAVEQASLPPDFVNKTGNSESPFAPSELGGSISSEEPLNTLPEC